VCLILIGLLWPFLSSAQVSFTHTLDNDFNAGVFNDLQVVSNTVRLPLQATSMGSWTTTTVIPETLAGHKVATWNNRFSYVTGGYNGSLNSSSVYRTTLGASGISAWTAVSSLPDGVRNHATIIGDNTIYVIGGVTHDGVSDKIYYASMSLNGNLGEWKLMDVRLPVPLQGHTAVYCNGYVYVAGGTSQTSGGEGSSSVLGAQVRADGHFSDFISETVLPVALKYHTMEVEGEDLFIIGGEDNDGNKLNTVYKNRSTVNGTLGSWNLETALPAAISNHASFITNGLLVAMGGENTEGIKNDVYYTDVTTASLDWQTSTGMTDFVKDFVAFGANGMVVYSGGANLSGVPITNTRVTSLSLSANQKSQGLFVSTKFDELGAERIISELVLARTLTGAATLEVSYRIAGNDGIWGSWTAYSELSLLTIEETGRYLQYKVKMANDRSAAQAVLQSVTMRTPGSQLSGNISGVQTYTKEMSPYWVTDHIIFTGGTHTFEAGTQVLFLPEVTMEVRQANIICNGAEGDSIYFTGYLDEEGLWGGIYFSATSNSGVSSQFNYVVISNAGHGTYGANLYSNSTSEPQLNNCVIRNSTGRGIRLRSADIHIQNTKVYGNATHGVSVDLSSPTFINADIRNNVEAGIMITSGLSNPTFSSTIISQNKYGIYYNTPNTSIKQPGGSPVLINNDYDGIVLPGGEIVAHVTWHTLTYNVIILESITVRANRRLTIEPGNTIRVLEGAELYFGTSSTNFAELYAVGTAEQPIRFTSYNGESGGWNGIRLRLRITGQAPSELVHCIIENGREYNVYADGTVVNMVNSSMSGSQGNGIQYSNSWGILDNCHVLNNGNNGVYLTGASTPVIRNCLIEGSAAYPLVLATFNSMPVLENNSYLNNVMPYIALSGGRYSSGYLLQHDGIPYHVLANIEAAGGYRNPQDFIIEPGVELLFDKDVSFIVGVSTDSNSSGNLKAEGTEALPIIFRAFDNVPGGWGGVVFNRASSLYNAASILRHCIIEQGNTYNIYCDRTSTPVMEHVIIRNAVENGVYLTGSSPVFNQCQILNNGANGVFLTGISAPSISNSLFGGNSEYPLFFATWDSQPSLANNSYTDNGRQFIAVSGGNYTSGYTMINDGIPYQILNDIVLQGGYRNPQDFIIEPGVELLFNPGVSFHNGISTNSNYQGNLIAEGTSDTPITFKAFDEQNGWGGILFNIGSDLYGASSIMTHCIIEQGVDYNVFLDRTTAPRFNNNVVRNSGKYGIRLWNAQPDTLRNNTFANNMEASLFLDGTSNAVIGGKPSYVNSFFNSPLYAVHNNTANEIDARYNFWSAADSAMISKVVYDVFNESNRGKVNFVEFAQLPWLGGQELVVSGELFYGNEGLSPMSEAVVSIVDFSGGVVSQQTVSETGAFAFAPFASGGYRMTVEPVEAWGGVNATDALLVLNHFTRKELLTGLSLAAADINLSGSVNATDALFMLKRFAGLMDAFPSGDFLYHYDDYVVNGNEVVSALRTLCFGDVNGSYSPLKSLKSSSGIISSGELVVTSFTDFEMPFDIEVSENAGAVSFGFYYPEGMMKVKGVRFEHDNGYVYSAQNGLFRFAWAGVEPIQVSERQSIRIIVEMESLDLSPLSDGFLPELFEVVEVANQWGDRLSAMVSAPELRKVATSLNDAQAGVSGLAVFPNPVRDEATIRFSIDSDALVSFDWINASGSVVLSRTEVHYSAGRHQVILDGTVLSKGVYMLGMRIKSANGEKVQYAKVVVSK
jgi:parallel beta-helix repeat protein